MIHQSVLLDTVYIYILCVYSMFLALLDILYHTIHIYKHKTYCNILIFVVIIIIILLTYYYYYYYYYYLLLLLLLLIVFFLLLFQLLCMI